MLKSIFDAVMERRARQLMDQVGAWLPTEGPILDLGSGPATSRRGWSGSWVSRWLPPTSATFMSSDHRQC